MQIAYSLPCGSFVTGRPNILTRKPPLEITLTTSIYSTNNSDIRHIKCKNQQKRCKIAEILHSNRKSGWRIERRCLNLHWKFINNRFCACAVQMLLKMAAKETICSTFEVQYCKSTSTRTTAIRHVGHL